MQVYYALRQMSRMWELRQALKRPTAPGDMLLRILCSILASEVRTWLVIGPVTLAALFNVVAEQGWGSAILAIPAAWGFHQGAQRLRKRFGITAEGQDQ
jgi:hypothetical protein